MVYEYRNQATNSVSYGDLVCESDSNHYKYDEQFVAVEDVDRILNSIEKDVRDIQELLNGIEGIYVIDNVKYKLDELWKKL